MVIDEGGVTGHPHHEQATRAALAAADHLDIGVLAWPVRGPVAAALNAELGTDSRRRCAVEIVDIVLAEAGLGAHFAATVS